MSLASADCPPIRTRCGRLPWPARANWRRRPPSCRRKARRQLRTLEIEKLKLQIAKLRRMQFGRSSERLARHIEQLELRLEELEAGEAEEISKATPKTGRFRSG